MAEAGWIALDWPGRRGWLLAGAAADDAAAPRELALPEGDLPQVLARLAASHGPLPVLVAGAPGAPHRLLPADARRGYVPAPHPAHPHALLLPELAQADPPDMTGGDGARIAGFLQADPDFDGILCLVGRSSRWLRISAGEVVSLVSWLTGDIIAALDPDPDPPAPDDDFSAAVDQAFGAPHRVAARLFSLRAARALGQLSAPAARARLYGLLIGQEVAGTKPWWLGLDLAIQGPAETAALYARALGDQGAAPRLVTDDLTLAGLRVIHANIGGGA